MACANSGKLGDESLGFLGLGFWSVMWLDVVKVSLNELDGGAGEGSDREPLGFGQAEAFPHCQVFVALALLVVPVVDDLVDDVLFLAFELDGLGCLLRLTIFIRCLDQS